MYKIDYPQYVIRYRFTPVHFLLAFFAFLATLTTASPLRALDPLPQVNGTPFGAIPGSFGVDESGSSIYNIPLRVAPGTRGIEPQLSLNYNSASANTLIAVGWSLGGLSAVTRCPSTVAQDGQADGIDFDALDRFCLDGARLSVVQGGYGSDGSVYYTESATFARITAHGSAGSGPESFIVEDKSGHILEYGATPNSRIQSQTSGDVVIWHLNQISDRSGNFMELVYHQDYTTDEHYPLQINYTGRLNPQTGQIILQPYNRLEFEYELRPDPIERYVAGIKLSTTQRLLSVKSYTTQGLAKEYRLSYDTSTASNRSLLRTVRDCDDLAYCRDPISFDYTQQRLGFENSYDWAGFSLRSADRRNYVDINADGFTDYVQFGHCRSHQPSAYPNYLCQIEVALSDRGVLGPLTIVYDDTPPYPQNPSRGPFPLGSGKRWQITDVSGDGLPDIVWWQNLSEVVVAIGRGTDFEPPTVWLHDGQLSGLGNPVNIEGSWESEALVDLDLDGFADYVWTPKSDHRILVARGTGAGFNPAVQLVLPRNSAGGYHPHSCNGNRDHYVDVNGDSITDKAFVACGSNDLYVALGNGRTFDTPQVWLLDGAAPGGHPFSSTIVTEQFHDFNGDGKDDYVWKEHQGESLLVAISNGAGFEPVAIWAGSGSIPAGNGSPFSNAGWHEGYADLNGDGRTDKAVGQGHNQLWGLLSHGSGFVQPSLWLTSSQIPAGSQVISSLGDNEFLFDVNGDGLADRVWSPATGSGVYGNWYLQAALAKDGRPDLLQRVVNSLGKETIINYEPLSNTQVYTKGNGAVYPQVDIQPAQYVVASHQTSNGAGGFNSVSYTYEHLLADLHGRGFCGFRKITARDLANDLRTDTSYHQDHPFKARVEKIETRINSSGILLKQELNTWSVKALAAGTYYPYLSHRVTSEFELDGSPIKSTIIDNISDDWGNLTQITTDHGQGYTRQVNNVFNVDPSKWFVGQLLSSSETATSPTYVPITRTTEYGYDPDTGLVSSETIEPNNNPLRVERTFVRDDFGNVTETVVTGPSFNTRSSFTVYDTRGQFPIESRNSIGHSEFRTFDVRHGKVLTHTGPNGLVTEYQYDAFGTKIHELLPDGTERRWLRYRADDPYHPANAVYYVRVDGSQQTPELVFFNVLGAEVRRETRSFNSLPIYRDQIYNNLGQLWKRSRLYHPGNTVYWESFNYDLLGRVLTHTEAHSAVTNFNYSGLSRTSVNDANQSNTIVSNVLGKTISVSDALGNTMVQEYDGFGNLTLVRDPDQNETHIRYDIRGHRIAIDDPDLGLRQFEYDALGNVVRETDAKGQIVINHYDQLGRMIRRDEPEGITAWQFDIGPLAIGRMSKVSNGENFIESYSYDSFGRLSNTTNYLQGRKYTFRQSYDEYGRIRTLTYPSGFTLRYDYSSLGFLETVADLASGHIYFSAQQYNQEGFLSKYRFGNGLETEKHFNPARGSLERIRSGYIGNWSIQDHEYEYDSLLNLTKRIDHIQGREESFGYDHLSRLTSSQVVGGYGVSVQYDALGNIEYKSDVGTYHYRTGSAGPHAVSSLDWTSGFTSQHLYDANGNLINDGRRELRYGSHNKPTLITKGESKIGIAYGPHHTATKGRSYARYLRLTVDERTPLRKSDLATNAQRTVANYYVGDMYEERYRHNALSSKIHYIRAMGFTVAVYTEIDGQEPTLEYLHRDVLGSVDKTTDSNGNVLASYSYDAWGKRRNADWSPVNTLSNASFPRGFTGHEHLDPVGLIHMNGRVYDPTLGRFLSPDPAVQTLDNLQGYNRYSYVLNNPFLATDPSGFFFGRLFRAIGKFFKRHAPTILSIAAFVTTNGLVSGQLAPSFGLAKGSFGARLLGTISTNFASSVAGGLAQGASLSDVLRGGLPNIASSLLGAGLDGVYTGKILAGINQHFPDFLRSSAEASRQQRSLGSRLASKFAREFGEASVHGARSLLTGGNFKDSFVLSAAGGGLTLIRDGYIESQVAPTQLRNLGDFGITWRPGVGLTVKAADTAVLIPGANNIFRVLNTVEELRNPGLFQEGGSLSRLANLLPGANSGAVLHDVIAEALEAPGSNLLSSLLNLGTIPPAIAFNYAALYASTDFSALSREPF